MKKAQFLNLPGTGIKLNRHIAALFLVIEDLTSDGSHYIDVPSLRFDVYFAISLLVFNM